LQQEILFLHNKTN